MANPKDKSSDKPTEGRKRINFSHDGGKPKVQPGSNSEKKWAPPKKGTTPSNRKK